MALSLGQLEVVDLGSLPISSLPFTMVGWFRVPNVSKWITLMQLKNTATTSYHSIIFEGTRLGKRGREQDRGNWARQIACTDGFQGSGTT